MSGFNASKVLNILVCTEGNEMFTKGSEYKVIEYDKFDNWTPFKVKNDLQKIYWVGGFICPKSNGATFEFKLNNDTK